MKAYKVFNSDWTCRDFKFEVGKEYKLSGELIICKNGFHACEKLSNCFNYYDFDPKNKIAEVEILGNIVFDANKEKLATDHIMIIKELSWEECLKLCNSGNWNSGNRNSGNRNSGNRNSGDWNSGNRNSGNRNSGNRNSGDCNSGHWNSGNWNSGNWNSGNWNSGNRNSGNWNSGNWNSGDWNSGNWNSGNRNSGNWNSGNWNSGNWNSGHFNINLPDKIRIFEKWVDIDIYDKIKLPSFLYFDLTVWVSHDTATQEEKERHKKEIETCGGFLKKLEYKEAFQLAYSKASKYEIDQLKAIPGFDKDIFYKISGIIVD